MVKVIKKPGESDDRLIARFKKKVLEEEIIPEARARAQFVSKAEKRKEKKKRLAFLDELKRRRTDL